MSSGQFLNSRDRGRLFRISRQIQNIAQGEPVTAELVRSILRARRLRDDVFGERGLFTDPAWDMMLDLLAARLEGNSVSISSLCLAAGVPPTTALRWIKALEAKGYLERRRDSTDGRRIFIALTEDTAAKMIALLELAQREPGQLM